MNGSLATDRGRVVTRRRRGIGAYAPIAFKSFEAGGQTVRRRDGKPIVFMPTLDAETGSIYVAADDVLGVDTYGETRRELAAELEAQLRMRWEDYALADDSELAADARALKRRLLSVLAGE